MARIRFEAMTYGKIVSRETFAQVIGVAVAAVGQGVVHQRAWGCVPGGMADLAIALGRHGDAWGTGLTAASGQTMAPFSAFVNYELGLVGVRPPDRGAVCR